MFVKQMQWVSLIHRPLCVKGRPQLHTVMHRSPGKLPIQEVQIILSNEFSNFSTFHVIGLNESNADIPTELPYSSDLKNLNQLPVQEVLGGT